MNTLLYYPVAGAFQILSWSLFSNNQEWAEARMWLCVLGKKQNKVVFR